MSSQRLHGPTRQPSLASTASAAAGATSSPVPTIAASSSPAQRLRRLIWDATIPIVVTVESEDLPHTSLDRSIETHYIKAPRISYLPLVLQEVKSSLLAVMMDDTALNAIKEEDYWFMYEGTPLRWHWPVGLLFDYHTANTCPSAHRASGPASTSGPRRPSMVPAEVAATALSDPHAFPPQAPSSLPWRLTLRIGNAPLERMHSSPGLDNCRTSFMSMLKEADFVRWGSTKRVTNLRKTEQDALWEGVVSHNFDTYWSVASKIIPAMPDNSAGVGTPSGYSSRAASLSLMPSNGGDPSSVRGSLTQQFNESQTSLHSAAPSESGVSVAESTVTSGRSGNQYRSLPMRFHLLPGAPIVQEPVAPYTEDGRPTTLHGVLSALFPLLFPPTPTFATSTAQSVPPPPLAYAVIQGIRVPLEAEIPWIGAALASADGWIAVCVHLLTEGEKA